VTVNGSSAQPQPQAQTQAQPQAQAQVQATPPAQDAARKIDPRSRESARDRETR
jgi:hypothetical protein